MLPFVPALFFFDCKSLRLLKVGSPEAQSVKNAGDTGSIPGSGRYPEKETATHSSILALKLYCCSPSNIYSFL